MERSFAAGPTNLRISLGWMVETLLFHPSFYLFLIYFHSNTVRRGLGDRNSHPLSSVFLLQLAEGVQGKDHEFGKKQRPNIELQVDSNSSLCSGFQGNQVIFR